MFDDVNAYLGGLAAHRADVSFYDFSHLSDVESASDEIYDATHPSEVCYARMILQMENDPHLAPYVAGDRIRAYLEQAKSPLFLYPPVVPALANQ